MDQIEEELATLLAIYGEDCLVKPEERSVEVSSLAKVTEDAGLEDFNAAAAHWSAGQGLYLDHRRVASRVECSNDVSLGLRAR